MNTKTFTLSLSLGLATLGGPLVVSAQQTPPPAPRPARPQPPARDPKTPGYVEAKELPDGQVPPADANGNFVIGPTHPKAPEMTPQDGTPKGTVHELTMKSSDSKMYP